MSRYFCILSGILLCALPALFAQSTGTIKGTITLKAGGSTLHNATVNVLQLRRNVESGDDGTFELRNVPPGTYDVIAHMHALTDEKKRVTVQSGVVAEVNFELSLASLRQEVTVTASGQEETTLETFQSVTSLEGFDLAAKSDAPSLGELLDNQPGIAKRSFGPGTSRPVVRGFDGDRVLILQDGTRTGTLSSQSGDHGEPIDPSEIERVEVVRGPATLLYGSSAIGGVVNVITRHHELHEHPHPGFRGSVNATGGTNNALGGTSGNLEFGLGNWLFWGGGGSMRTGDYHAPIGEIPNSGTRMDQGTGGFGHYSDRTSVTLNYDFENGRYGVPFSSILGGGTTNEPVDLDWKRQHTRFQFTRRDLGVLDTFTGLVNYTDWHHKELEGEEVGTEFFNKQFTYQGTAVQKTAGTFSGSFGVWGLYRDYKSVGLESLSPPVTQNAIAGYVLEQVNFERFRIQAGGRVENNRYHPQGLEARSFTGFNGGVGINVNLWRHGVFVANYSHSYRAPAIEELYNYGPHVGNLAFEIGNPDLLRERGNGLELSLRQQNKRIKAEANAFYYRFSDYVFLAATNEYQDGLRVARYLQGGTRYMGAEGKVDAVLSNNFTLNLGVDAVDAKLTGSGIYLPRIPPVRGRIGVDAHKGSLSVRPEVIITNAQWKLYPTETRTAGYAVVNLTGSYTITRQHVMHVFNVNLFNAGDRLYYNHLSFIKELAPEIGRGVRVSYTLNFY